MKIRIKIKKYMLQVVIKWLNRIFNKPESQQLLYKSIPYFEQLCSRVLVDEVQNHANPYKVEILSDQRKDILNHENVIFITGRFRSGSTLLWNIFRDIEDTTSFYEPFNERRWFDKNIRGGDTDKTHLGVDEYWKEYDGLDYLGGFFKDSWGDKQLYMSPASHNTEMLCYIDELIRSANKRVVLQFNRLDFRLGWIRKHYPKSKIIHIYRDPREQWVSFVKNKEQCNSDAGFESLVKQDYFYLRRWGRDLRYVYPFLNENKLSHLYELFYLIWRLSYNHGVTYSDHSISIESISENTQAALGDLFTLLGIDNKNLKHVKEKVRSNPHQKWKNYAEYDWFREHEERCEKILSDYYSN